MKTLLALTLFVIESAAAPAQNLRELGSQLVGDLANNLVAQQVDSRLDGDLSRWNQQLNTGNGRCLIPNGARLYFVVDENSSDYSDDQIVKKAKIQAKYWGAGLQLGRRLERDEELKANGCFVVHLSARQYHGFSDMESRLRRFFGGFYASTYGEKDFALVSVEIEKDGFSSADNGNFEALGADTGRRGLNVDVERIGFSSDTGDNISRELDDAFCRLTKAMTGTDPRDLEKERKRK